MPSDSNPDEVAGLLEQASRLIHSAGHAEGLYPAQWSALRYFAEAPPPSRTTAALARFQGMNLGPVARTVRTLVDKGLLVRRDNPKSRRADLLDVTPAGARLLERAPHRNLATRIADLPPEQRDALAAGLQTLLDDLFRDWKNGSPAQARHRAAARPTPR